MIEQVTWTPCNPIPDTDGMVLLHSDDDGVEIYVHRSGRYAVRVAPVGGGWAYSIALLDRRMGDRRQEPHGRGYWHRADHEGGRFPNPARSGERRNASRALNNFLRIHGNGEAES